MADKIDQLKIGSTLYDIDLPKDATPSVATVTATGAIEGGSIKKTGGTSNQFLKADGSVDSTTYLAAAIPVTYSQLATLINNNQLIAGSFYRITDFVTTTAQPRTQSAGHAFDLIVHAISTNELSEDANAVLHEGDTYFADSNLSAWVIKYSFTNNTDLYAWADATNGKGVIYYLQDEFYNEAGYDFKNIQFARYKVTACAKAPTLVDNYCGMIANTRPEGYTESLLSMSIDINDFKYYYTFDCYQTDYSLNPLNKVFTRPNGTTFTMTQLQCVRCKIPPEEQDDVKLFLNNACIIIETSRDCFFNFSGGFNNSTLLGGGSASVFQIYGSIIGGPEQGSYSEAFSMSGSTVKTIANSVICCARNGSGIAASTVGTISSSYLVGASSVIYSSTIAGIFTTEFIGTTGMIYISNVNLIQGCTGSATYFLYGSVGSSIVNVTITETVSWPFLIYSKFAFILNVTATRISSCSVTSLRDGTFAELIGCTFNNNRGIICNQNMTGCSFGYGVNYVTISSSDTTQTITNTRFHDIAGVSGTPKVVVIPEDYSQRHTVDVYSSAQLRVYEID